MLSGLDALVGYHFMGRSALGYLWMPHPGFDFFDYTPLFPYLHSPQFFRQTGYFPWVYPAPGIFVLYPFYLFATPTHWVPAFLAFAAVAAMEALLLALWFAGALRRRGMGWQQALLLILITAVLGWPLYFAFQRGNIELLLWPAIAAAVICFTKRRFAAAALLIGVFGAAKIYPLLFLALMLRRDRLRYLALGIAAAVLTTLAALRFLEPDIHDAWLQISTGVARWTTITTLTYFPIGIGPDHSFLGLTRQLTLGAILHPASSLHVYLAAVAAVTTAAFLLRVRMLPAANQALFIACAAILLPPTSYDYTLVIMLLPWAWMVLLCAEKARSRQKVTEFQLPMLLFGIALAPMTFVHTWGGVQVYFEGPVRSIALLSLAAYAAIRPLTGDPSDRPEAASM